MPKSQLANVDWKPASGDVGKVLTCTADGEATWQTAGGGGVSDGDKGDITVSGGGATWTIDAAAVTFAKMQSVTGPAVAGRETGSGAMSGISVGEGLQMAGGELLGAAFTSSTAGDAPASGGGTTNFLRADGTWAAPPGGGGEAFPVGSVFLSVVSTNPGTLLGYGTWSAIAAGRVLVGFDSGDPDFDTAEETGGAKTVAAAGTNADEAAHTHNYTDVPNHVHVQQTFTSASGGSIGNTRDTSMSGGPAATAVSTADPTGGVATGTTVSATEHTHAFTGSATSVVQPYFVVYIWKRTA